jgi:hypothetical protein
MSELSRHFPAPLAPDPPVVPSPTSLSSTLDSLLTSLFSTPPQPSSLVPLTPHISNFISHAASSIGYTPPQLSSLITLILSLLISKELKTHEQELKTSSVSQIKSRRSEARELEKEREREEKLRWRVLNRDKKWTADVRRLEFLRMQAGKEDEEVGEEEEEEEGDKGDDDDEREREREEREREERYLDERNREREEKRERREEEEERKELEEERRVGLTGR